MAWVGDLGSTWDGVTERTSLLALGVLSTSLRGAGSLCRPILSPVPPPPIRYRKGNSHSLHI